MSSAASATTVTSKFVPVAKGLKSPFFPMRYVRTEDLRATTRLLQSQDAMVQEHELHKQANRDRRFLNLGNTRQTAPAPWSARRRPTHFVALNLPQQSTIRQSISALHDDVQESFTMNQWLSTFVPLSRLHLTLSVITIDDAPENQALAAEQLRKTQLITQECILDWQRQTQGRGFALRSNMLGFFDEGRVAFARVATDYDFQLLNKCVRDMRMKLAQAGIDIKGNPNDEFVPHITIAKISGATKKHPDPRVAGARALPKTLFSHMQWDDLGLARFGDVNLCCMRPLEINQTVTPTTNIGDGQEGEQEIEGAGSQDGVEKETDAFEGLEESTSNVVDAANDDKTLVEKKLGNASSQEFWDSLVKGSLFLNKQKF